MKFKTKKGTEITIGDPSHHLHDHFDNIAGRVQIVAGAASSLSALAGLAPNRGKKIGGKLEGGANKAALISTAVSAGAAALRAVHSLRNPEGPAIQEDFGRTFSVPDGGSLDELHRQVMAGQITISETTPSESVDIE